MVNGELVTEFDKRHAAAVHRWQHSSDMAPMGEARERHVIEPDASRGETQEIESLLIRGNDNTLIVPLQGALGRNMETPRFEWVRALGNRKESLLFISDSALSDQRDLYLSWYFGTAQDDVQERIARYIEHVASKIGATKIVLFGHSGGGYAAIALGQRIRNSRALALNPQVHIERWPYCPTFIKRVFGESKTFAELDNEFPQRTNLLRLLESKDSYERLVVLQNEGDETHVVPQFGSLAAFLNIPPTGGTSADGKIHLVLENHGPGHIAPPIDGVNAWLDRLAK